ncbi:hypothetical protein [Spiroplasma tabanidicola]|uniref:Lipoprotein n=1 Tax=Spiroplasma tabanidicola TaxID=324079 RepID=A0A6I6CAW1_9MOLU|nr:hypothetical protein [Spiroplasma tabanidicola]QGS52065.1 hypothetical protein STABA_v1c07080 [Spiroplasma tabanidicola]
MKKLLLLLNSLNILVFSTGSIIACNKKPADTNQNNNNNNDTNQGGSTSSTHTKRDLNSIKIKELGDIKGSNKLPTLQDILSKLLDVNKEEFFTTSDVKFSSDPTLKEAKIEALATSTKVFGSTTITYNYVQLKPSFAQEEINLYIKVFEERSFSIRINNPVVNQKLEVIVPSEERDAKCLKIITPETSSNNSDGVFTIKYKLEKYIDSGQGEEEKYYFVAPILLKYDGLEKIVHVECSRINLYQDIVDTAIVDLGEIDMEGDHPTLEEVLKAWNGSENTSREDKPWQAYKLTTNDVKLDYWNEEEHVGPELMSTYNKDSAYSNFIQIKFEKKGANEKVDR